MSERLTDHVQRPEIGPALVAGTMSLAQRERLQAQADERGISLGDLLRGVE